MAKWLTRRALTPLFTGSSPVAPAIKENSMKYTAVFVNGDSIDIETDMSIEEIEKTISEGENLIDTDNDYIIITKHIALIYDKAKYKSEKATI